MVYPFNELTVTPPDERVKNGIVSTIVIELDDICVTPSGHLDLGIVDGVVTKIKMKCRSTYHGKRYDRTIQNQTINNL